MKEIIITYFFSYLILFISSFIYVKLGLGNMDQFLSGPFFVIMIVFYIIVISYLYTNNKKNESKLKIYKCFPIIYFGISISVFLNMIIFRITGTFNSINNNLLLFFVSSGIIGPIYEEILFRYILYNRLKSRYSEKKSFLVGLIIFSLIHLYPIKIIYAFILGFFFTYIYKKEKTIMAPILMHIGANSIVILLYKFNIDVFILSLINLIISSYLIFRANKN